LVPNDLIAEEGEDDDSHIGSDSGDSMDTCCYNCVGWPVDKHQQSTAFVFVQYFMLTNNQLDSHLLFSAIYSKQSTNQNYMNDGFCRALEN
jgi:hypothetical protein